MSQKKSLPQVDLDIGVTISQARACAKNHACFGGMFVFVRSAVVRAWSHCNSFCFVRYRDASDFSCGFFVRISLLKLCCGRFLWKSYTRFFLRKVPMEGSYRSFMLTFVAKVLAEDNRLLSPVR